MIGGSAAVWNWGESLAPVRALIARGGILVIPTESSYGLAVDPRNPQGVEAVYRCKRRERGSPLPVVLADLEQVAGLGGDPQSEGLRLLADAWPAPLTVIVDLDQDLPASAGTGSLAIRVPDHERLRNLMREIGSGLTATSANRSGEKPILDPAVALDWLRGVDALVVDDGVLPGGRPSTLVRISDGNLTVLRRGSYPQRRIEELVAAGPRSRSFSATAAENLVDDS